jgi:hypothetical protein
LSTSGEPLDPDLVGLAGSPGYRRIKRGSFTRRRL